MPTFLVIGAMKAGTTSLEAYLAEHPEVFMSPVKEPNFFAFEGHTLSFLDAHGQPSRLNWRSVTDIERYRALFAGADGHRAVGEISHWYLYHPDAAERIRSHLPDVRLIAVLRDPVERAYSEFLFHARDGRESETSFAHALDLEEERIRRGCDDGRYVDRGLYHRQLARFYERFPSEQIRVYLFEDLRSAPEALFRDLFGFIGADPGVPVDTGTVRNVSGIPKREAVQRMLRAVAWNPRLAGALKRTPLGRPLRRLHAGLQRWNLDRPAMEPEVRARLRAAFRPDVRRLQDLIGRDLGSWLDD